MHLSVHADELLVGEVDHVVVPFLDRLRCSWSATPRCDPGWASVMPRAEGALHGRRRDQRGGDVAVHELPEGLGELLHRCVPAGGEDDDVDGGRGGPPRVPADG
jgi:hypothetical protein